MVDASNKNKNLTVRDVCAIIKACSSYGVTSLKFGELQVKLNPKEVLPSSSNPKPTIPTVDEITEHQHEDQTKEALEDEEIRLRQSQIALALIENPELAEQLMIDGELEDDDDSGDDDPGE